MAQRRMFSKSITNNDNFIELPATTQNLYFHLSMNADDDGFVDNWKSIMRMIGSKEDDIKLLIAKSYLIPFESGIVVIKHWRLNNYLRSDRHNPTNYQEEFNNLSLKENGSYELVYQMDTNGIHRLGKDSIDKISIDNIYSQVEVELGMTLSPINYEKINYLIEKYGEEKFKEALATTSNANKKSLNYLEGVLKNKNFKRTSSDPEWLGKEIKNEKRELSDEDKRFMEEVLNGTQTN